ncbi:threonine aspartase [Zalerion maritima]|uniref:Threonine aspartase n=1 Tax=Zalerion maritima TaxID=339359 RepID=A0AAD5RMZ4_9PEZI|nr:threonine aspartase [Zalerion maritima]
MDPSGMDGFPSVDSLHRRMSSSSQTKTTQQPVEGNSVIVPRKNVGAIFLHAGAGYHSPQNEMLHLSLLHKACFAAMGVLKVGGPATEAVEAAVKVMEDAEFTNAGIGSNLNEEGIVENDANIIDHLGRSGACGAVPGVKNPICLAREVLENSNNPDFSWRIPPNLLVGNGARNFAMRRGIEVCTDEALVTRNSRLRWIDWKRELEKNRAVAGAVRNVVISTFEVKAEATSDHTNAVRTGTWNEGQPDSPTREQSEGLTAPRVGGPKREGLAPETAIFTTINKAQPTSIELTPPQKRTIDEGSNRNKKVRVRSPLSVKDGPVSVTESVKDTSYARDGGIQDTVGAIAIDVHGKIAAGSSSGGVGMKLEGRVGPAALVGIGTAVVPVCVDEDDEEAAIATVCSGTGEHFATTQAAQRCAESIRHRVGDLEATVHGEEITEDMALEHFIRELFLEHPSIVHSKIQPGIGVLAVKQCPRGYYVYWGHNTTSFAVASFSTEDKKPKCVVSRRRESKDKSSKTAVDITMGARKFPATPLRK